ncbi:DUF6538 domain-containing protein [Roseibium sediminis]|uniref:DUF6538 domain-containing protein n=1 Tax=Roseibium sediminis TaxID=1775174 RepID=UPI00313BB3B8
MGISINLSRRGAVYYWRCRIPSALATRIGLSHLKMSMKTREPDEARFLAAQLNATARQVFMEDTKHISRSQLEELFRKSFLKHKEKLDLLADSQRMSGTMSSSDARQMDRAMGHAYK